MLVIHVESTQEIGRVFWAEPYLFFWCFGAGLFFVAHHKTRMNSEWKKSDFDFSKLVNDWEDAGEKEKLIEDDFIECALRWVRWKRIKTRFTVRMKVNYLNLKLNWKICRINWKVERNTLLKTRNFRETIQSDKKYLE